MGRALSIFIVVAALAGCQTHQPRLPDPGPQQHLSYTPQQVSWEDGPASLPEGAQVAMLEGDPSQPGVFTMRLKLPDGYIIPPHWHPNVERVTVISGTFNLGHGSEVDPEATDTLPAGSYTSMPPGMHHFAIAEGETVIELTSVGPWEIHYIDPADDPRQED